MINIIIHNIVNHIVPAIAAVILYFFLKDKFTSTATSFIFLFFFIYLNTHRMGNQ